MTFKNLIYAVYEQLTRHGVWRNCNKAYKEIKMVVTSINIAVKPYLCRTMYK